MSCRTLVCALLLIGLSPPARPQTDTQRDGNWWTTISAETKNMYVVGMFDGMHLGGEFAYWGTLEKYGIKDPAVGKAMDSYDGLNKKYFSNVTSLQVSDGLTEFYKDYRNRSISVSDALWPVVKEIAGDPQAEIDSLVRNLRKNTHSSP
jgi:hypothetical protein